MIAPRLAWRSLVLRWRRWQRWRAEQNRKASGVLLSPARKAYEEQLERSRQLGTPEPQEQRPGSRSYWQEHGGEK